MPDAYNRAVLVFVLFFLSGLASLVLETVFRRQLTLVTGSAVTATSVTLAIFLGGLALGAAVLGRVADRAARPMRLYGSLELGVGFTGAAAVAALAFARPALLAPARGLGLGAAGTLLSAAIAALLLLPPTLLMGGTLPALARQAVSSGRTILGSTATLYGVNTLGAAAGAALAGFVLFERAGVVGTGLIGAALAAGVGAAAIAAGRSPVGPAVAANARSAEPGRHRTIALIAAALSGASALGYEVVWTRLLVLPLRSFTYSFSLMLTLVLSGLVVGSLLLARIERLLRDPLRALAIVQIAGSLYVASSLLWIPFVLAPPADSGGFGGLIATAVLRAGPVALPPTILSGMALPLAVRVYAPAPTASGDGVGTVYAVNTLGSIAGALAAGLVLLPLMGASRSLSVVAACGAIAGACVAAAASRSIAARSLPALAPALCLAAALLPAAPFVAAYTRTSRAQAAGATLYFHEGASDTVAVVRREYGFRDADAKSVVVNGIQMTATVKPVWRYMAAEGHLPALYAQVPTNALVICVGTGITLGALASHATVTAIDAVDLSESVLGALPTFKTENRAAYRDPKVTLIHADGRHWLELTSRTYGLITLEPPPPIVAGSVHLYTRDFYALCRKHLAPGGVVAQWLPLHAQSLDSAKATARTFVDGFPYAVLWLPSVRDAVLIGSDRPLRLDPERLRAAYADPATRASLEAAYFETPEALLGTFLLDRDGILRWSQGADLITDDRPTIEFFRRYGRTMSDREILTLLDQAPAPLDPAWGDAVEAERRAHRLYVRTEIDKEPQAYRDAALASRATRFGLYRLGCDRPQLDALRADEAAWNRQSALCRSLGATEP
jgi:spermidine synthase